MRKQSSESSIREDLRELPVYGIAEAAHYLRIPRQTLRSWVLGRPYPTRDGAGFSKPIIQLPSMQPHLLSFMNLVEAHILDAIRRKYGVQLPKIRRALKYLEREFPSRHPLVQQEFETDGLDLFIEKYGQLINISREGQTAVRALLEAHLHRIERDTRGLPIRLYPFTRPGDMDQPRAVVIDPRVSFGRPVLAGTGIATAVIAERYKAGESTAELAQDYGREQAEIEEAIRCELQLEAA